jgi:hypothetical protein
VCAQESVAGFVPIVLVQSTADQNIGIDAPFFLFVCANPADNFVTGRQPNYAADTRKYDLFLLKNAFLCLFIGKNYSTLLTQKKNRPIGVTIIAILAVIMGILLLISGLALLGAGTFFSITSSGTPNNSDGFQSMGSFFGIILLVSGAILMMVGIGYLVVSYGLLKGKGWAWTITVILTIISLAIQIISGISNSILAASITNDGSSILGGLVGQIIGIAIDIIILYYLYRPHVKAFFGKSSYKGTDYT